MRIVKPHVINPSGHYSPGIISNGMLYISGQLPINHITGKIVSKNTRLHINQALKNVDAILQKAGCSRKNVVMCKIYIPDINLWDEINEEYTSFFGEHKPARVIVPGSGLHLGALVEVEAIAEMEADNEI